MSQAIAPPPPTKDFFISYTGQDRTWAEWIAWVLEEAGYTVVIQAWDFRPGGNFVLDMQQATMQANRTIAVLSSLYLDKPFPQPEWAAAFAQDPTSRDRKLIPVRIENCAPPGLLAQIVYIDVFDCNEPEAQQRLLSAVTDGRMKPSQRPRFPGKEGDRIPFPGHASPSSPDAINRVSTPSPSSPSSSTPTHPSTHPPLHPSTPLPSLSTYDSTTWVGREQLIADLTQKLRDGYRILAITGITGIGKTALAERLVVEVSGNGIPFHRLNFDDRGQGRDFLSGALTLLPKLGETVTTEDQKDPQNALRHLLNALRHQPFLVQIDSLEMLLQGDEQTGWNEFTDPLWVDFFQQLLAGDVCQSQLLLTSQALPEELEMEAARYPRGWHRQDLGGLTETEQLQLFEKYGLKPDGLDAEVLQRFVDLYQGHPLVLQVIARDILDKPFNGNVQQYWQRYQAEFNQLDSDAKQKGNSPRALQLRVKQRVEQALNRLPADARQMLCRSSVYRRPVPEEFWLAMMAELAKDQQWAVLELLKSHNLAEQELRGDGVLLVRQHNLVRSVAHKLLKGVHAVWQEAELMAANMWSKSYQPELGSSSLEQVRGKLEAFYHHCEVGNGGQAKQILDVQLSTPLGGTLYQNLTSWGYYRDQLCLAHRLLSIAQKTEDNRSALIASQMLGTTYLDIGDYTRAIEFYQLCIEVSRRIRDTQTEIEALIQLGRIFEKTSTISNSVECFEQAIILSRRVSAISKEIKIMVELGLIQKGQNNYKAATKYFQDALSLARNTADLTNLRRPLRELALIYSELKDYPQAIEFLQQYLEIERDRGDRLGQGVTLGDLALFSINSGKYQESIEYSQQYLDISIEIGDRMGEIIALGQLGRSYRCLNKYSKALECFLEELRVTRETGSRSMEAVVLGDLGITYDKLGDYNQAIKCYEKSITIAFEIKDCNYQATLMKNLGFVYFNLKSYDAAIEYYQRSLLKYRENHDQLAESRMLNYIGDVYCHLDSHDEAIKYYKQSLIAARNLNNSQAQAISLFSLGTTLIKLEQFLDAQHYLQAALEIFETVTDKVNEAKALLRLGSLFYRTEQLDEAREFCDRALAIASELGIPLIKECEELQEKLRLEPSP